MLIPFRIIIRDAMHGEGWLSEPRAAFSPFSQCILYLGHMRAYDNVLVDDH